jgi:replication factor C large subunit
MMASESVEPVADWCERYRPQTESELEGNDAARKRIRSWLRSWTRGTPDHRGLLLTGPPGVGKTSIVGAIANDLGWDVIELNASDARNAAAIRRVATAGATHFTFGMDGSFSRDAGQRTIILLDEVDHLQGTFRATSEKRIGSTLAASRGDDDAKNVLTGDTGGKAELMRLLKIAEQPVIMTCNDEMRLWGSGHHWRPARDRFNALASVIQFRRATDSAMRRIAHRVLDGEGAGADGVALDRLLQSNPGDLRALIRDLQMIIESGVEHIDMAAVELQLARGSRDQQIDLFPGLEQLYRTGSAAESTRIGRELEKTPPELVAWISWNNGSVLPDGESRARAAEALTTADQALAVLYENNAFRSWYWAGVIAALSASVVSSAKPEGRISLSFPEFLRRGNEPWRRGGLIETLAGCSGSSQQAAREELWPQLAAIHDVGDGLDANDFSLNLALGLDADSHLLLHGLPTNRVASKRIAEAYTEARENPVVELEDIDESVEESSDDDEPPAGQQRLDMF